MKWKGNADLKGLQKAFETAELDDLGEDVQWILTIDVDERPAFWQPATAKFARTLAAEMPNLRIPEEFQGWSKFRPDGRRG